MNSNLYFQHSQIEPLAPLVGGLRWRRRSHDVFDQCRGRGFIIGDPDAPPESEAPPRTGGGSRPSNRLHPAFRGPGGRGIRLPDPRLRRHCRRLHLEPGRRASGNDNRQAFRKAVLDSGGRGIRRHRPLCPQRLRRDGGAALDRLRPQGRPCPSLSAQSAHPRSASPQKGPSRAAPDPFPFRLARTGQTARRAPPPDRPSGFPLPRGIPAARLTRDTGCTPGPLSDNRIEQCPVPTPSPRRMRRLGENGKMRRFGGGVQLTTNSRRNRMLRCHSFESEK